MYAAQEIPQIDTEIAQKGHFRMETKDYRFIADCSGNEPAEANLFWVAQHF